MWRAIGLKGKKKNIPLVVSNSVCRVSLTDFPRELNSTYISIEISFQYCVAKRGWEREGGSGYCRWFRCLLSSSGWITITLIDKTPPPPTWKVLPALCHCFGWTTCMCSFAPHIEKKVHLVFGTNTQVKLWTLIGFDLDLTKQFIILNCWTFSGWINCKSL